MGELLRRSRRATLSQMPWYADPLIIPIFAAVFLLDRLTKILVVNTLAVGESIPREGIFRVTYVRNTGSAFGLFPDQTTFLIVASLVGIGILILLYRNHPYRSWLLRLSLGLQMGGATGNLVDRVQLSAVIDFIDLGFWPVFNLADASLVVGLSMLVWVSLSDRRRRRWFGQPALADPWDLPQGNEGELEELLLEEELPATRELVAEEEGERLDSFLARREPGLSRSRLQQLIQEGLITVNGRLAKPATRVRAGDRVLLTVPPPKPVELEPEVVPLEVVYQDEELMVVEKPPGLPVHPGPGHPAHTLVNGLLALCPDLKGIGGELRPGIVHRLDKDTSGLLVVAKTQRTHQHLSTQLKERLVRKGYTALVTGRLAQEEGLIEAPIGRDPRDRKRLAVVPGGREASTRYRVLQHLNQYTLVEAFPLTGRTHQIRVHFASLGHPLLGDPLYGKASPVLGRQFLHAHYLGFHHPVSGEWLEFRSPLPPDLQWALAAVETGV